MSKLPPAAYGIDYQFCDCGCRHFHIILKDREGTAFATLTLNPEHALAVADFILEHVEEDDVAAKPSPAVRQ